MLPTTIQTSFLKWIVFLQKKNQMFPEIKQSAQGCLGWAARRKY